MKRNTLLPLPFFLFFILLSGSMAADKDIKWEKFDKGMELSKGNNKKIIISVYTDWCSWCKKMEGETYKDSEVAKYINDNFIAIKMNAESSGKVTFQGKSYTERELTQGFGITGFPATIFFSEKQEPITVVPGYLGSSDFLNILKFVSEDAYKSKNFEDYLKGK